MHPHASLDYAGFLTEVLKKYMEVFGSDVILLLTKHITSVKIHTDGTIIRIEGSEIGAATDILSQLYMLSDPAYEQLVKTSLTHYPEIQTQLHPHLALNKFNPTHAHQAILHNTRQ